MTELYSVGNPINREERNNLNATFRDIQDQMSEMNINTNMVKGELKDDVQGLQTQINMLVVNGDSSPEAAQARVNANNVTFPTLKARIDNDIITTNAKIDNYITPVNPISFTFNAGYTGNINIYRDGKKAIVNIRVTAASGIADNALIDIGTFANVNMRPSTNIPANGMIALTVAPSYSKDVVTWVQSDSTAGIARLRLLNGTTSNKNFIDISVVLPTV